jgi:excisionase family DNA binding protein
VESEKDWWTADRAAAYLSLKRDTLLKKVRRGEITGYIVTGTERIRWRFLREDLDATLRLPSVALKRKERKIQ